jgi:hypothetical protein
MGERDGGREEEAPPMACFHRTGYKAFRQRGGEQKRSTFGVTVGPCDAGVLAQGSGICSWVNTGRRPRPSQSRGPADGLHVSAQLGSSDVIVHIGRGHMGGWGCFG